MKIKYYLLLALAPFLWSTDAVLARAIHSYGLPIFLSFLRWSVAFLCLLPFVYKPLKEHWSVIMQYKWRLLFLGWLSIAASPSCAYRAVHFTTPMNTGIIEGTAPAFILLLTAISSKKSPSLLSILGIGVAFAGILCILLEGHFFNLSQVSWSYGDLWILLSVLAWALYTVALAQNPIPLPLPVFLCVLIFCGLLCSAPLFLFRLFDSHFFVLNWETVGSFIYLGIFPSLLGYFAWILGIQAVGSEKGGLFMNLYPVFTTLLSIIFLSQPLFLYELAGLLLVCSGIYLLLKAPPIQPSKT